MKWPGNCTTEIKGKELRGLELLAEAVPDDLRRELELLAEELESLKVALLRCAERERAEVLASATASLPPKAQLALALRYQEKLTPKEAAAVLGVAEESVCRMERRALKDAGRLVNQKVD
ncbi:MAG: sigma factor-like helix-turn-helix DNA-binding protein [Bacillota bacterium]